MRTTESHLRTIVRYLLRESSDPGLDRAIAYMQRNFPDFFRVGGAIERGPDGKIYSLVPENETKFNSEIGVWRETEHGAGFAGRLSYEQMTGEKTSPPPRPPPIPPEQHPTYRPPREKGKLPSHDPAAPFEKYAFEPQRRKTPNAPAEREENTPVEDVVYFDLMDHVKDNKFVTPEVFEIIDSLVKKGLYPDVFEKLPPTTPIYRGTVMSAAQIQKNITPDVPGQYDSVNLKVDIKVGKKNMSSSWTLDPGMAHSFASATAEKSGFGRRLVILTSTVGDAERAVSLNGFYQTIDNTHADEKEVVCLGPVRVKGVYISGLHAN